MAVPTPWSQTSPTAPKWTSTLMTEHGAILIDGVQQGTTQRCPHCGGHFLVAHGDPQIAKRLLGSIAQSRVKCERCGRLTCGRPGCNPAIVGSTAPGCATGAVPGADRRVHAVSHPARPIRQP